MEIRKCLERKDGVKMVIVPKKSDIRKGDYICIEKLSKKEIKEYYQKHKEEVITKIKEYSQRPEVKARRKEYDKQYQLEHKEELEAKQKEYYQNHKVEIQQKAREKYLNRTPEVITRMKEYRKENYLKNGKKIRGYLKKPEVKERRNKNHNKRRQIDDNFKILLNLRGRVNFVLKHFTTTGKIYSSNKYGINYKAIIEHLSPFPEDINNYEIHHIKPLFTFNFINPDGSTNLDEIKIAFAPQNHKLLTIEKHKKINHFELK